MNPLRRSTPWPFAAVAVLVTASAVIAPAAARELSTDRPDRTESAYTVERGRWQIETDLVSWSRDEAAGVEATSLALATTNLKLGIARHADLQLVVGPWVREEVEAGGFREESSGAGDLVLRWKQNLGGNDGGPIALAVMPFVQTSLRDESRFEDWEGGLIVPLAVEGPAGWGFGFMGEVDVRKSAIEDRHYAVFVASATAARDLAGPLGGYVELWGAKSEEPGARWDTTFDLGLTWGLGPDLQLDAGANIGLADATEDLVLFLGFSARR